MAQKPSPSSESEFSGQVRVRCDYETYVAFWTFANAYYSYEHALEALLRVADENPELFRREFDDLGVAEDTDYPTWG